MKRHSSSAAQSEQSTGRATHGEQIVLPNIICATVRPSTRRDGGWVAWVSQPGYDYDDCKVLLPNEGIDMSILPHQVLFFCDTDLRHINASQTQNRPLLRGMPIGKRSWVRRQDVIQAEQIVRADIEKVITDRALRSKSHQVMDNGHLPFIKAKSRSIKELLRLAMVANFESNQALMEIVSVTKPISPQGITIGSSFEQVCGHDCLVMNANNDIIAAATSYAISKGWWIFSCAQNPEKTQWIVAMTTTPQAAFNLDAEAADKELKKIEAAELSRSEKKPITIPRPAPAVSKVVAKKPAIARTGPKTVVEGFGGLDNVVVTSDAAVAALVAPTEVISAPIPEVAAPAAAAPVVEVPVTEAVVNTSMALLVIPQTPEAAAPAAVMEVQEAAAPEAVAEPVMEAVVEVEAAAPVVEAVAAEAAPQNSDAENERRIEEWVATMDSKMQAAVFTALLSLNTLGMIILGTEEATVMGAMAGNISPDVDKELVKSATAVITGQLGEHERNILAQTLVAAM